MKTATVLIKATVCLLLTAALSVLAGCGESVRETDDQSQLSNLYDAGNITVYRFDGGTVGMPTYDEDWYNDFLDYYLKNYGGTVSSVNVEWEGWEERFNTDLASGTAPDLINLFEKNYVELINRDLLVSVEELSQKGIEGINHPSLFLKQELASNLYTLGDKSYSFACAYAEADMIFVNENLFKSFGVKSPSEYYKEGRWDYKAFEKCVKSVYEDSDGDGKNDIFGYYGWDPNCFIVSAGGRWIDADSSGKFVSYISDSKTEKGFKNYRELYLSGCVTDKYSSWLKGKVAMVGCTPQNEIYNLTSDRLDFEWSVVPFPLDDVNSTTRPGKCYGWAIPRSTVNLQGCVSYVVALNAYEVTGPSANLMNYSNVFSVDQLQMISDCVQDISIPIYNGVGSLGTYQWEVWGALKNSSVPFKDIMSDVKSNTEKQLKS